MYDFLMFTCLQLACRCAKRISFSLERLWLTGGESQDGDRGIYSKVIRIKFTLNWICAWKNQGIYVADALNLPFSFSTIGRYGKPFNTRQNSFVLPLLIICRPQTHGGNYTVPEIIDPVFAKTSQNARFLLSENERLGLVFVKTGSINSGTVYQT